MNLPIAFLQGPEIWVILIVVLILFGGAKIPQLMRGVGRGMGEFQRGVEEGKQAFEKVKSTSTTAAAPSTPEATDEPETK